MHIYVNSIWSFSHVDLIIRPKEKGKEPRKVEKNLSLLHNSKVLDQELDCEKQIPSSVVNNFFLNFNKGLDSNILRFMAIWFLLQCFICKKPQTMHKEIFKSLFK